MIKKTVFLTLLFVYIAPGIISAQSGKLLLIGGGTEYGGSESWNGEAFEWAVEQSRNKKVALISYNVSDDPDWLTDHFISDWGAEDTKNFVIDSRHEADAQDTYDSLMEYDVLYIKGGDQYNYYSTYNNTKTEQAILDKYAEGGVICGTSAGLAILSEVKFTAENGVVYPEECLLNWDNQYVTLADDFLNLFPGYIFDSHFSERGRFSRLLGFMAYWRFTENATIVGLGLDDMTAMGVDENNVGTVFGTGCANIYQVSDGQSFIQYMNSFAIDSLSVKQLLQGCTIDFNTGEINGFTEYIEPEQKEETGNINLLASGADILKKNKTLLENFVDKYGNSSDTILLLTGSRHTEANSFKNELQKLETGEIQIYSATSENTSNKELKEKISQSSKLLFVNLDDEEFGEFLQGSAGEKLSERIHENGITSAFIGDDARWAGHTVIENYLESGASFHGELTFREGLDLLSETVIIPKTFDNSDIYENTATAIPYSMVKDTLTYGIWLTEDNHFEYSSEEEKTYLHAFGEAPVMIIKSNGTNTGFSEQTLRGLDDQTPRMIVGFEYMTLSLIGNDNKYKMGK